MDYDVFIVPSFTLDTDYNYDIKVIIAKDYTNNKLVDLFSKLDIEENLYFKSLTKKQYYCSLSCLIDIKKWLINLSDELNVLNIKSNLDNNLFNKAKEVKK